MARGAIGQYNVTATTPILVPIPNAPYLTELRFTNNSPYQLTVTYVGVDKVIDAYVIDKMTVEGTESRDSIVTIRAVGILTPSNPPATNVTVEATWNGEKFQDAYPQNLTRQVASYQPWKEIGAVTLAPNTPAASYGPYNLDVGTHAVGLIVPWNQSTDGSLAGLNGDIVVAGVQSGISYISLAYIGGVQPSSYVNAIFDDTQIKLNVNATYCPGGACTKSLQLRLVEFLDPEAVVIAGTGQDIPIYFRLSQFVAQPMASARGFSQVQGGAGNGAITIPSPGAGLRTVIRQVNFSALQQGANAQRIVARLDSPTGTPVLKWEMGLTTVAGTTDRLTLTEDVFAAAQNQTVQILWDLNPDVGIRYSIAATWYYTTL